jgi:peptidoglycan/xylan/chitin deacetylase (PgdA/CDA1 family)
LTEEEFENTRFQRSIAVSDAALRTFLITIRRRFNIISLQQLIDHQECDGGTLDASLSYACITFDDGWHDNYTNAFPILKELNIPATIFLSTAYIESARGFWWQQLGDILLNERLSDAQRTDIGTLLNRYLKSSFINSSDVDEIIDTIKREHYSDAHTITEQATIIANSDVCQHGLNWSQCQEMSDYNISFGSHSISHPRLSLLSKSDQEKELALSKVEITQKNVNYVNGFCYPYGDLNKTAVELAKQHYDIGLTTSAGIYRFDFTSTMQVPRINVHQELALDSDWLSYRLMRAALRKI